MTEWRWLVSRSLQESLVTAITTNCGNSGTEQDLGFQYFSYSRVECVAQTARPLRSFCSVIYSKFLRYAATSERENPRLMRFACALEPFQCFSPL